MSIDTDGRLWRRRAPPAEGSQLVVPCNERRAMIRRFHDSLFAGHLGISRTVFRLQTQVYWPGLRNDVRTYVASCTVCKARKLPCPRRAPMGHVAVGRHWERAAMDLLDMSITSAKGNRYMCWLWWIASLDGRRPVRCRIKQPFLWRMLSSVTLYMYAASACQV